MLSEYGPWTVQNNHPSDIRRILHSSDPANLPYSCLYWAASFVRHWPGTDAEGWDCSYAVFPEGQTLHKVLYTWYIRGSVSHIVGEQGEEASRRGDYMCEGELNCSVIIKGERGKKQRWRWAWFKMCRVLQAILQSWSFLPGVIEKPLEDFKQGTNVLRLTC